MRKKHSNDGKVMTKDDKEKGRKKKRKSNIRNILLRQREFRPEICKYTLITQQLTRTPQRYEGETSTLGHNDGVSEGQPCNDEKDDRPPK